MAEGKTSPGKADPQPNIPIFLLKTLLAFATLVVIYYGGYYYCNDIAVPASMHVGARFAYTFRWSLPMLITLVVAILWTSAGRNSPAVNPLSGNEHIIQIRKNILTNTLEQFTLSIVLMLAACTFFDTPELMKLIPIYSVCFTVGRILFAIGYSIHPYYRTWGIMMNFFSSLALLGYLIYLIRLKGITYDLGTTYPSIARDSVADKQEL